MEDTPTELAGIPMIPSLEDTSDMDESSCRLAEEENANATAGSANKDSEPESEPDKGGMALAAAEHVDTPTLPLTVSPTESTEDAPTVDESVIVTPPDEPSQSTDTTILPWSHVLASPSVSCFTPSLDANHTFHGTGFRSAVAHSKQSTHSSRRCLVLLLEVATLKEHYAQALLKAGQGLHPVLSSTAASTIGSAATQLPTLSVQEATLSWSREWTKLAQGIKESLTLSAGLFGTTHADAVSMISSKYSAGRQTSVTARQRALTARTKYHRSVEEAEKIVSEWRETSRTESVAATAAAVADESAASENESTATPSNAPPPRVASKLKQVQHHWYSYKRAVEAENQAVRQCQRLEEMVLQSMQNLQQDRVAVLLAAMKRVLVAERQALNEMMFALKENSGEHGTSETLISEKKGRKSLANLLKATSNQFEMESSGVMDAETLGIPDDIGKLRDHVRTQFAARTTRIQVVRGLATFLEQVSTISVKLGRSLKQLIEVDAASRNPSSVKPLDVALQECEGPRALRLWGAVKKTLEQDADSALSLASTLRTMRSQKLDGVLLYSEKSMKASAESDDVMWKQVCEAARAQSRAENRYRQTTAQSAKARERVQSVDSDPRNGTSNVSPKRVNKHLANMFSILPDGGGQAMKMLAPGARASIAQRNLEEAGQKESKGRQVLDSAVEVTAVALRAYKTSAETLSAKYEQEDVTGWEDVKVVLELFVTEAELLRKSKSTSLEGMKELIEADAMAAMATDINEWAIGTQEVIAKQLAQSDDASSSNGAVFMLTVDARDSAIIGEMLLGTVEVEEAEAGTEEAETKDGLEPDALEETDVVSPNSPSSEKASPKAATSDPQIPSVEEMTPKWMKRSLSASSMPSKSDRTNTIRRTLTLGKRIMSRSGSVPSQLDADTDIFLKYFWPDKVDSQTVPHIAGSFSCSFRAHIAGSFSCSFRDSSQRLPSQYGRVFVTSARLVFASWSQKRLVLKWSEVTGVETAKNIVNTGDDTLLLTYKKGSDISLVLLGGFLDRHQTLQLFEKTRAEAKVAAEAAAAARVEDSVGETIEKSIGAPTAKLLPPDSTLQKMEIVLSRHLRNVSIQRYYEIVWSEGNGTDEKPLYGPWLEKAGFDVGMGDWDFSEAVGPWCKERYPQKRVATFKVKRRTHLYIGPVSSLP